MEHCSSQRIEGMPQRGAALGLHSEWTSCALQIGEDTVPENQIVGEHQGQVQEI